MPQRDVSIPRMGNWRGNFWWAGKGSWKSPIVDFIKDPQPNRPHLLGQRGDSEVG